MRSKLVRAWCVYIVLVLLFVFGVETYHKAHKDASTAFRCRILINKDLIVDTSDKKEVKKQEKHEQDGSLYEKTQYGMTPKISITGERVFDRFSAKTSNKKFIKLAVALEKENLDDVIKCLSKLETDKITFIIPHYMDNFKNIVKTILEHGHEIFILLPTQKLVSDKEEIAPFLANSNQQETLDKLLKLISTSERIIGVANITPTFLTKSSKDMDVILLELAKRGLAFFDIDTNNDVIQKIVQKTGAIYLHADADYQKDKTLKMYSTYFINLKNMDEFMKLKTKDIALAPISQEKKDD